MDTQGKLEEIKPKRFGYGGYSNTFGSSRNTAKGKNGQFIKKKKIKFPPEPATSQEATTPILATLQGSRLVDLNHLQRQMQCTKCLSELSIRAVSEETILGLASVLTVVCNKCFFENKVQTSKLNPQGSYNINIAAVLGNFLPNFQTTFS